MPKELIFPSIVMSLALVAYSAGVWLERARRDLKASHVLLFWAGLACDGFATSIMRGFVAAGEDPGIMHTLTGLGAFGLMAIHAVWATFVLRTGSAEARAGFHRYSIVVWAVWLLPYFGGMIAGIARGVNG